MLHEDYGYGYGLYDSHLPLSDETCNRISNKQMIIMVGAAVYFATVASLLYICWVYG